MKKLLSLLTALLLLLSLTACGTAPAKDEQSPDNSGTQTGSETQPDGNSTESSDGFTPVTTEEEVRALYAPDYEKDSTDPPILEIIPYEGDFLVRRGWENDGQWMDWVYGQSGIRRNLLSLGEPLLSYEIQGQASVEVVAGGPSIINGVPAFPYVKNVSLNLDEQGMPLDYNAYSGGETGYSSPYWAGAGESYYMGMQGRREAVRSAQIDASGVTVAFAPLADGSDFVAAYCEIPYTLVSLPEKGNMLSITFYDTFLDSGKLADGVTTDYLHSYGSLYPEDFPAGELTGSCVLIQKAEIAQEGNNVVLTLTLDTDRLSEDPLKGEDDAYFLFTADASHTGIADNGPYFRLQLRIADELFH